MISKILEDMTIREIAELIKENWPKPYFGAVPYIKAMEQMNSIDDYYGADPGKEIVIYFLSNANTWRGPVARAIKAELKRRYKTV